MALPRWQPDDATRDAGITARTTYTNAPLARDVPTRYRSASSVQIPVDARTQALREAIKREFPGIAWTFYAGGRSKPRADTQRLGIHQAGRALDCMIPRAERSANGTGDRVANWIVRNADRFAVQYVTWKGTVWSTGRTGAGRWYARGSDDHDNHIHAEIAGPQGHLDDGPRGAPGTGDFPAVAIIAAAALATLALVAITLGVFT